MEIRLMVNHSNVLSYVRGQLTDAGGDGWRLGGGGTGREDSNLLPVVLTKGTRIHSILWPVVGEVNIFGGERKSCRSTGARAGRNFIAPLKVRLPGDRSVGTNCVFRVDPAVA
ncbi:hypothetical protein EVAR_41919_1 [Eumeta japonica]|uniref:Uncharacterized protein n=1 Tax=Eumeta variegata TaxID=151549 RepID=A0A4C1XHA7_EUMVA|nr:hypothetical protein EVAR_41919_1 [Eumeta japonica]